MSENHIRIAGFTIIRNAITYDYPVVESISSILPLVEKLFVAVGQSEDDTLGLIKRMNEPKISIIETVWDDRLREGGAVLAVETDKAFDAIGPEYDWAVYIQGDEVLHENSLEKVRKSIQQAHTRSNVDGLTVAYTHFYGSYKYIGDSRSWYRNEIRVIRNDKSIRSYKDAQGFRKEGKKLNVMKSGGEMFHYGWVKDPKIQKKKEKNIHRYWHTDEWIKNNVRDEPEYDYYGADSLAVFTGTHPAIMKSRVEEESWQFNFDTRKKNFNFKKWVLFYLEKWTGWRPFEYKNYRYV